MTAAPRRTARARSGITARRVSRTRRTEAARDNDARGPWQHAEERTGVVAGSRLREQGRPDHIVLSSESLNRSPSGAYPACRAGFVSHGTAVARGEGGTPGSAPRPKKSWVALLVDQRFSDSSGGQVGEDPRCPCGHELCRCEPAGRDRERRGADGAGGRDVFGGIADHDQPACVGGHAEMPGAARDADAQERGAVLRVAAEAAEGEVVGEPRVLELDACTLAQVARAEADGELRASGESLEQRCHAGEHAEPFRAWDLGRQRRQVDGTERIDRAFVRRQVKALEPGADYGAISHAVEPDVVEDLRAGELVAEDAHDGAPSRSAGGEERAVDVEEKDGRSHRMFRARWCGRYPLSSRRLQVAPSSGAR